MTVGTAVVGIRVTLGIIAVLVCVGENVLDGGGAVSVNVGGTGVPVKVSMMTGVSPVAGLSIVFVSIFACVGAKAIAVCVSESVKAAVRCSCEINKAAIPATNKTTNAAAHTSGLR
mgnify:CR=1 FL=1